MRVIVVLTIDGTKETRIEGDAPVFGRHNYRQGHDKTLESIGFWLSNWRFAGHGGPNSKSRVFVPWSSALYIEEVKEE